MSRPLGLLVAAGLALAGATSAVAQEKSFAERAKEYWEKVLTALESGAKSAGDEYHKLKAEAATASGPAREKLAREMEVAREKWSAAREKLTTSLEHHAHAAHEELKALEDKASTASGSAREKWTAEAEVLSKHWEKAREKVSSAFSSNMKSAGDEYAHLRDEAAKATEDAKAKLRPQIERLKAEWATNRDKLVAFLKEDLRRTEEDLHKAEEATSETAKALKEKLTKKLHDLRGKYDTLTSEKLSD